MKFAVSYFSLFDNELNLLVCEANDWKDALRQTAIDTDLLEYLTGHEALGDAKLAALQCDFTFCIVGV